MADTTVFNLTATTTVASGDLLPIVDVSDTAQSANGSTRKVTFANFLAGITSLGNLATVQGHTLTLTGAFVRSGAHSLTLTTTGATNVTYPTTGTLATLAGAESLSSKTLVAPTISGISVADGASVTTANAMGALAIDVTKGLNTKSISTESTFTFSGTPATANTWFGIHVTNTDTAPHILTFPSAFSQVTQAARTTCPIAASGQLYLLFRYDGSGYKVFGDSGFLNKFDATTAPGVTNDLDEGYGAGSLWLDATGNAAYICESAADGAAVWHGLTGGVTASSTTTFTNKTYDTAGTGNSFSINGVAVTANTGTGAVARAAGPTFTTPALGVATATSLNGNTFTTGTYTLTGTAGKTLTFSNSITLAGTDATTMTFPPASASIGYLGMPLNSQSSAYTLVLADAGKCIYHPAADTTARTWTIPADASVTFPSGTSIMIDNDAGAGALTIAITSDTLVLVGAAGSTGSRTLASGGRAFLFKVSDTRWRISGTAELT